MLLKKLVSTHTQNKNFTNKRNYSYLHDWSTAQKENHKGPEKKKKSTTSYIVARYKKKIIPEKYVPHTILLPKVICIHTNNMCPLFSVPENQLVKTTACEPLLLQSQTPLVQIFCCSKLCSKCCLHAESMLWSPDSCCSCCI